MNVIVGDVVQVVSSLLEEKRLRKEVRNSKERSKEGKLAHSEL